jgi:hypothetical protein
MKKLIFHEKIFEIFVKKTFFEFFYEKTCFSKKVSQNFEKLMREW